MPTVVVLVAPVSGQIIPIEEVPDPVFAEKMMGESFAIMPDNGEVVAPVAGNHASFSNKTCSGIFAENGAEILIYIGLETVHLNGEGFTAHVREGDQVKQG